MVAILHGCRPTRPDGARGGVSRTPVSGAVVAALSLAAALATAGCDTVSSASSALLGLGHNVPVEGQPGHVRGFLGFVVADEPRAALLGRDILSAGGNAADAAVAAGFALTVTMPSRAGLGGGGACLGYAADRKSINAGVPESVIFLPASPASSGAGDRPAAVPTMARGLFTLHARYGHLPFDSLIAPAEEMARLGVPISRAVARDLAVVAGPLFADPAARSVFGPDGTPLAEGTEMLQPDLGSTLAQLRVAGVGDFYQGQLAHRIEETAPLVGASITLADLRAARPQITPALAIASGHDQVSFLSPPADGGLAAAAAFAVLQNDPGALAAAQSRALAVAAQWRAVGGDPQQALRVAAPAASLPPLPASTSLVTLDQDGNAVACVFSMNNLFGTGRMLPRTGMLLAALTSAATEPLYAAAIAWNPNIHAFRAGVAGSGQDGAAIAVAAAMAETLRSAALPGRVPEPGRANVIECGRYLPDDQAHCVAATDPRGAGLAAGSN
jgi:gamma-glutamyltranspeptidase/glutathione hydrolase